MIFNWHEYFELAEFLYQNVGKFNQITNESIYRTVVSRAYYAAYRYSRNYAYLNLGFIPTKTGDDHRDIQFLFEKSGFGDISDILNDLRRWRNQFDYDDIVYNASNMALRAIEKAKKIFDRL